MRRFSGLGALVVVLVAVALTPAAPAALANFTLGGHLHRWVHLGWTPGQFRLRCATRGPSLTGSGALV